MAWLWLDRKPEAQADPSSRSDRVESGTSGVRVGVECVADRSRSRAVVLRELAQTRSRLTGAQAKIAEIEPALKMAERRYNLADDHVEAARQELNRALAARNQAQRDRYQARQDYRRAERMITRLQERTEQLETQLNPDP